jgi:hypothetical protein
MQAAMQTLARGCAWVVACIAMQRLCMSVCVHVRSTSDGMEYMAVVDRDAWSQVQVSLCMWQGLRISLRTC